MRFENAGKLTVRTVTTHFCDRRYFIITELRIRMQLFRYVINSGRIDVRAKICVSIFFKNIIEVFRVCVEQNRHLSKRNRTFCVELFLLKLLQTC